MYTKIVSVKNKKVIKTTRVIAEELIKGVRLIHFPSPLWGLSLWDSLVETERFPAVCRFCLFSPPFLLLEDLLGIFCVGHIVLDVSSGANSNCNTHYLLQHHPWKIMTAVITNWAPTRCQTLLWMPCVLFHLILRTATWESKSFSSVHWL